MWLVLSLVGLILAFTSPLKSWPMVATRQAIDVKDSSSKVKPLEDVHMLQIKNSDTQVDPTGISKTEKPNEIAPGSMKDEEASTVTDVSKGKPPSNDELNVALKPRVENTEIDTQMTSQNPVKHHKLEHENINVDEITFTSSSNVILDSSVENEKVSPLGDVKETPIKIVERRQVNTIATDLESNENIKPVPDNNPVYVQANTDSVISQHENHTYEDYSDNRNKTTPRHEQLTALAIAEIAKLYPLILFRPNATTNISTILSILNVTEDASDVSAKYRLPEEIVSRNGQNSNKFAPTDAIADAGSEHKNISVEFSKVEDKKVRRVEKETASDKIIEDISNKKQHGLILGAQTVPTTNLSTHIPNIAEDASDTEAGYNHKKEMPSDKNIEEISNKSYGVISDHTISQSTSSDTFILNVTEVASDKSMKYRHHDEVVKNGQTTNANITEATNLNNSIASSKLSLGISSEL